MSMPRMRLVKEAFDYIKENDPNTHLTLTGFRRLINEGEIPHIRIGRKQLVNLDLVEQYFCEDHPNQKQDEETGPYGVIRAVKV